MRFFAQGAELTETPSEWGGLLPRREVYVHEGIGLPQPPGCVPENAVANATVLFSSVGHGLPSGSVYVVHHRLGHPFTGGGPRIRRGDRGIHSGFRPSRSSRMSPRRLEMSPPWERRGPFARSSVSPPAGVGSHRGASRGPRCRFGRPHHGLHGASPLPSANPPARFSVPGFGEMSPSRDSSGGAGDARRKARGAGGPPEGPRSRSRLAPAGRPDDQSPMPMSSS